MYQHFLESLRDEGFPCSVSVFCLSKVYISSYINGPFNLIFLSFISIVFLDDRMLQHTEKSALSITEGPDVFHHR